ncbi:MAG: DUF3387 domain-containing protein [Methanoregula sp.]|nr:DUF3387 domain-containing protein [Methanoregula sp.]
MSATHEYSEDTLVELPTIALFSDMRWETANFFAETFLPGGGSQGRETPEEVVLVQRLRPVLKTFNPTLPADAIDLAIAELIRDRRTMSIVHANREIYQLLKDGIKVSWKNPQGETVTDKVKVIDWQHPENNQFLLVSQFWITGDLYKRRCDIVGFINGIPLMVMENKASHKNLKNAYEENIRDYKTAIPQLFRYNAFIILSNGSRSAIGTISSEWEHFSEWKRINSEGEIGIVSIETMVRGTCDKEKFLDIVENFILFFESKHGTIKILAKNHQYLGVNNAIDTFMQTGKTRGRLGVFWHTQGSGKSYSMIFFSQKILRKIAGNWTFVIVTDRDELDDQIYDNFAYSGIIKETHARADSGEDLQRLLKEDHRFVFTLIQKFRTEKGQPYQKLTDRSDIIVIADEAHRTQYDTFALNMRTALPIYAPGRGTDEVMPVQQKAELVKLLKMVLTETAAFCDMKGIDIEEVLKARNLQKVKLLDDSVDAILVNDESKQKFLNLAGNINRLFKAIKPDPAINDLLPLCTLYLIISLKIRSLTPTADISQVMESIEELLDRSISTEGYVIKPPVILDLSQLNLDVLKEKIDRNRSRIETEKLRGLVERKVQDLVILNRTRINFVEKLQQMIDEYNAGSLNTEEFFKRLVAFARDLQEEEKRAIKENLNEEELTIFDLLTKPSMKLTKREEDDVKKVAKELLETLKQEKLVLDWRKKQQTRASVRLCIEDVLDHLPPTYSKDIYQGKCEIVYQHIFEAYPSPGTTGPMVTG